MALVELIIQNKMAYLGWMFRLCRSKFMYLTVLLLCFAFLTFSWDSQEELNHNRKMDRSPKVRVEKTKTKPVGHGERHWHLIQNPRLAMQLALNDHKDPADTPGTDSKILDRPKTVSKINEARNSNGNFPGPRGPAQRTNNMPLVKKKVTIRPNFTIPNRAEFRRKVASKNGWLQGTSRNGSVVIARDALRVVEKYNKAKAVQEAKLEHGQFQFGEGVMESVSFLETMDVALEKRKSVSVDQIYWSETVEALVPKGISNDEADAWMYQARRTKVRNLTHPTWSACGRPPNGIVEMDDGSNICARNRESHQYFVVGEVLSYWLSRLLGLDCVPPVVISRVNSTQWSTVGAGLETLQWNPNEHVALIKWIDGLQSVGMIKLHMPKPILWAYYTGQPLTLKSLLYKGAIFDLQKSSNNHKVVRKNRSTHSKNQDYEQKDLTVMPDNASLSSLYQWSNMIVFDYITGNYDRVASMQDGAFEQNKPSVIEEAIRNLGATGDGAKLWLFDNESGLLDAYQLIYGGTESGNRFLQFHDKMLKTMCIFSKKTIDQLAKLYSKNDPGQFLEAYTSNVEPLFHEMNKGPGYPLFQTYFKKRLNAVVEWMEYCTSIS